MVVLNNNMYTISFTSGDKTITKQARNAKEVKRLVYIYSAGSQHDKDSLVADILTQPEIKEFSKQSNKIKKDGAL